MNRGTLLIALFALTACAAASTPAPSAAESDDTSPPTQPPEDTGAIVPADQPPALPDKGSAPELENEVWLNVDEPLRLAELRGQVVALEMWTFG